MIQTRRRVLVNTDPQRRCYNGYHYSSEWQWTGWECLEGGVGEHRLKFWKELNDYAVSQRGKSAEAEFRYMED